MHAFYEWLTGPLAWAAFLIFIGGSLYRLVAMLVLVHQKEPFIFSYMSWKYSLRSILHWVLPFGTTNWKRHPVLTVVTFAFHLCLFLTPLFLLAHVILWDEAWHISWWSIPDSLADMMTLVVVGRLCLLSDQKDHVTGGSIRHFRFRLCDSVHCCSALCEWIYCLSPVVQLPVVSQPSYSFRRNHADYHSLYTLEPYDILSLYTGVYGVGVRCCETCQRLVISPPAHNDFRRHPIWLKRLKIKHPRDWTKGIEVGAAGLTEDKIAAVINSVLATETGARLKTYVDTCIHCGLCSEACHYYLSHDNDPRYSPVGKVKQTMWEMLRKKGRVSPEFIKRAAVIAHTECNLCKRCAMYCPFGIDIAYIMGVVRRIIHRLGVTPLYIQDTAPQPRRHHEPDVGQG